MSNRQVIPGPGRKSRAIVLGLVVIGSALALSATEAGAARGGGGGGRGGGGAGGGQMAQSSVSGANRAAGGGGASANRAAGGGQAASTSRAAGGGGQAASTNRGGGTAGANRGDVASGNRGDVNSGNRVNTGNVNVGNDVNINIDGGYGYHGGVYHPVAAAATIGAIAVTTAAVVGSTYYALPPTGCTTVIRNGVTYSQCGSVYYQQTMQGSDPVYVVVNP